MSKKKKKIIKPYTAKEKKFLAAVKTVLESGPCAGVNLYFYNIYGDECNSHYYIVDTYNKPMKEFKHDKIDDAIKYWYTEMMRSYVEHDIYIEERWASLFQYEKEQQKINQNYKLNISDEERKKYKHLNIEKNNEPRPARDGSARRPKKKY